MTWSDSPYLSHSVWLAAAFSLDQQQLPDRAERLRHFQRGHSLHWQAAETLHSADWAATRAWQGVPARLSSHNAVSRHGAGFTGSDFIPVSPPLQKNLTAATQFYGYTRFYKLVEVKLEPDHQLYDTFPCVQMEARTDQDYWLMTIDW